MSFCLPHRVSLVLAVEGIPVHWESLKVPKPSGSCPLCRAKGESQTSFDKALKKWVDAGRLDPNILSDSPKVSQKYSDSNNSDGKQMNYETQKNNRKKIMEENNRKVVSSLGSKKLKPTKKPNHLRLV